MTRICVGPTYSLLLQRLATIAIDKTYIPMTATAIASLGWMKSDLFGHLSDGFLHGKSSSDSLSFKSVGMSLVKSYTLQSNMKAETRLVEVLQMLKKHEDILSPKDIVDIVKTCLKLPTISEDIRSCIGGFLHIGVDRSTSLDPFVYIEFIVLLRRLKAKKSVQKCILNSPQVFAAATPKEICTFLSLIKDIKYCPNEVTKFLWHALINHPERASVSHKEAEKVFSSIPESKPSHKAAWWILSTLQRNVSKMNLKCVCKILSYLSVTQALKKHPITVDLYNCLHLKQDHLSIRQLLSCAFMLNRLDSNSNHEITKTLLLLLLQKFDKISWESYPILLNYALKVPGNQVFKKKLYFALESSLKVFIKDFALLSKNGREKRIISATVKCDVLQKIVELRYLLGMTTSIQNIVEFVDHLLQSKLDVTRIYGLFFVLPLLGNQKFMITKQATSLGHLIPNMVSEMSFMMCIKIMLAIDSFPIDISDLKPLVQRLKFFLEKNLTEQKFSLNQLNALVKAKVIYKICPRAEWDDLLGENIALSLERGHLGPHVIASALRNLTDRDLQLNHSVTKFVDIILQLPESTSFTSCDITSFIYFAASHVSTNSLRSILKQILMLSSTFNEFKLKEVNYILEIAKARGCERAEIPSNMISYLYSLKSEFIASGDLGTLFPLLPHFEIDVNPVVFNLMSTAPSTNAGWIDEATPKDLVQVLTNLVGTVEIANGPFIDAVTARFEKIINIATGDEMVEIIFVILKVSVVHQRCGKPAFIHQAINAVSKKVDSLCLKDIILLLKAVQISAHIFPSMFLMPLVLRMQEIYRNDPQTSIPHLNSALYGFYRVGLSRQDVFTDVWEFIHSHLAKETDLKNVSNWKLVDRLLNTMIISNIVHGKLAKLLISMIPEFDENKASFPMACRLYNSCVKLLHTDSSFVSKEILEKLKHLCLMNIFNSPIPMHVMQFVESASIRHTKLHATFDEESVSAILILAHRVNGSNHHLKNHCMNMIFKHLQALDIDPQKNEWLSEKGKVRLLVDGGYVTTTHVLRFADTYAKHFKKELPSFHLQDAIESNNRGR